MTRRIPHCALLIGAFALALAGAASAESGAVAEALATCTTTDARSEAERLAALAHALELAEAAVAASEADAGAHFAVFCALGRKAEMGGVGLGSLGTLRRLRREIDRTLELAPDWADALAAKATMLLRLPGFLGGDVEQAERLARRAVDRAPDLAEARSVLAEVGALRAPSDAEPPDGSSGRPAARTTADQRENLAATSDSSTGTIALLARLEHERELSEHQLLP